MPRLSNNDRNQALGMLRAGISTGEVARLFNCHQSRSTSSMQQAASLSFSRLQTLIRPSAFEIQKRDSSENKTSCHLCLVHCKWVLAHAKRCWRCRGVSSGPLNGQRTVSTCGKDNRISALFAIVKFLLGFKNATSE
jgi:hypothetical protein